MEAHERCGILGIEMFLWKCLMVNRIYGHLLTVINLFLSHHSITHHLLFLSAAPMLMEPWIQCRNGFDV